MRKYKVYQKGSRQVVFHSPTVSYFPKA